MAAVSRRPHPLHNFSLPSLKWGNQKNLRCTKPKPGAENPSPGVRSSSLHSESDDSAYATLSNRPGNAQRCLSSSAGLKSGSSIDSDGGTKKARQKLLVNLQSKGVQAKEGESSSPTPCNFKKRRPAPASDAPIEDSGGLSGADEGILKADPLFPSQSRPKSLRLRGLAPPIVQEEKKMEIPKIFISLSKEEIEEDFLAMTGSKPSRRPKKRARNVQKKLNEIFPGSWLPDITPDSYKIPDHPGL